jgi:hypothetical protein
VTRLTHIKDAMGRIDVDALGGIAKPFGDGVWQNSNTLSLHNDGFPCLHARMPGHVPEVFASMPIPTSVTIGWQTSLAGGRRSLWKLSVT